MTPSGRQITLKFLQLLHSPHIHPNYLHTLNICFIYIDAKASNPHHSEAISEIVGLQARITTQTSVVSRNFSALTSIRGPYSKTSFLHCREKIRERALTEKSMKIGRPRTLVTCCLYCSTLLHAFKSIWIISSCSFRKLIKESVSQKLFIFKNPKTFLRLTCVSGSFNLVRTSTMVVSQTEQTSSPLVRRGNSWGPQRFIFVQKASG